MVNRKRHLQRRRIIIGIQHISDLEFWIRTVFHLWKIEVYDIKI